MRSRREVPSHLRVTDPQKIPVRRYFDQEFYQLECEGFWPHVWQMACRAEQIPDVGDWIEYENIGKSVIVVRTKEGIKAFHNGCRHRGVQVAKGYGNNKGKGFICPFHGWRYDLSGKNTHVYCKNLFDQELVAAGDLSMKPCRVEQWLGFVFINFDDEAVALRETVGPLGDGMDAYNAHEMRVEWWYATTLPANWKIAMEAFMEGYHVMKTHPTMNAAMTRAFDTIYEKRLPRPNVALSGASPARDAIGDQLKWLEILSTGMNGMCHPKDVVVANSLLDVDLPDDPDAAIMVWYGMLNNEIMERGRARGEATPDLNTIAATLPVLPVTFFFPHWFVLPYLSSMAAYRIRPTGPETSLFEIWSLTHFAEDEEPSPVMDPVVLPHDSKDFPPVPQEDFSNIPLQQKGLHAEGLDFLRLARDGEGLISNYQRVIDGFIEGVPHETLAMAMRQLSQTFDGPILDFDLH